MTPETLPCGDENVALAFELILFESKDFLVWTLFMAPFSAPSSFTRSSTCRGEGTAPCDEHGAVVIWHVACLLSSAVIRGHRNQRGICEMCDYPDMSDYPELRDFLESFIVRYRCKTDLSVDSMVTGEELQALSKFLVRGIVDWVDEPYSNAINDSAGLGEFLDEFTDRYTHDSKVGMVVQVSEAEMKGLGMFLARGLVGWVLKLDQNRGRIKNFNGVIAREDFNLKRRRRGVWQM